MPGHSCCSHMLINICLSLLAIPWWLEDSASSRATSHIASSLPVEAPTKRRSGGLGRGGQRGSNVNSSRLCSFTMSSLSAQAPASSSSCRTLPGEGNQVQPKAPLLQILRVAGAQEEVFTLKEVMHYLGQYIMGKQLYDKQRQHIVHCQDDPLGELLEVDSFSVKNPSPVYEMLKKYLVVLGCADAAENLSVGRECVEGGVEDRGQMCGGVVKAGLEAGTGAGPLLQTPSQRRPREPDDDSLEGLPRSACKRPKLDVTLDDWDLSGLPWWFLGNLRSNYSRRSNGSTDIHTNQ
ncbi:protein Mdm4-like isoform X1, partial [Lates japonicus]